MDLCGQNPVYLKKKTSPSHPVLETKLINDTNSISMNALRSIQGIHAPMRLAAEIRAVRNMGRLPFLASSNASLDALTGRDFDFGFADFMNVPEFQETWAQPHRLMDQVL